MPENPLVGRSPLALEIRRLRIRGAMSQDDLAFKLSTKSTCVCRWENDQGIPTFGNLKKIAKACGVDAAGLLRLRNLQCTDRTGRYTARIAGTDAINYVAPVGKVGEAELLIYNTWAGGRAAKHSFVAGWHAACSTDVNFQFNG